MKSQEKFLYRKMHEYALNEYTKTCIKIHAWQGENFMIEKLPWCKTWITKKFNCQQKILCIILYIYTKPWKLNESAYIRPAENHMLSDAGNCVLRASSSFRCPSIRETASV